MYCLVPEKPLRLVYGTFYLAIGDTFYEFINVAVKMLLAAKGINNHETAKVRNEKF